MTNSDDNDGTSVRTSILPLVYASRKICFSAAHYFYLDELSEAENAARFGPSANRLAHGHNYEIEITVKGPCDPDTGMVVNLKDLKEILIQTVVEPMNFKNLNLQVPFFQENQPSLENMAVYLWQTIEPRLAAMNLTLTYLKAAEADDLYVEYRGEVAWA